MRDGGLKPTSNPGFLRGREIQDIAGTGNAGFCRGGKSGILPERQMPDEQGQHVLLRLGAWEDPDLDRCEISGGYSGFLTGPGPMPEGTQGSTRTRLLRAERWASLKPLV